MVAHGPRPVAAQGPRSSREQVRTVCGYCGVGCGLLLDVGRAWLFFGEQHRATDFYYEDELNGFLTDGTLTRLDTAFSRDQRAKVYVQDRMREHGPELWNWLRDGARFHVCGDASRMARDVERALRDIAVAHGGMGEDEAAAYVKQLAAEKRYVRDVY